LFSPERKGKLPMLLQVASRRKPLFLVYIFFFIALHFNGPTRCGQNGAIPKHSVSSLLSLALLALLYLHLPASTALFLAFVSDDYLWPSRWPTNSGAQ
jgi:hypothetical protein